MIVFGMAMRYGETDVSGKGYAKIYDAQMKYCQYSLPPCMTHFKKFQETFFLETAKAASYQRSWAVVLLSHGQL